MLRRAQLATCCLFLATLAACTSTKTVYVGGGIEGGQPAPAPGATGPGPAATLGIPPGHFPRPGECRIWIPGTPPGRQPRPRSRRCEGIAALAPAGSWILYRPSDERLIHVRVVDERRAGVIVRIRVFEAATGRFLREENP